MIKVFTSRISVDGLIIEGEEPSSIFDVEKDNGVVSAGKLKYKIKISLINDAYLATGQAEAIFELVCDKCLSHFDLKIIASEICHLYEDYHGSELDLTEDIREDILILLPHRLLCSESCKGICFNCGENLNNKKCSCSNAEKTDSVWSELNKLKV